MEIILHTTAFDEEHIIRAFALADQMRTRRVVARIEIGYEGMDLLGQPQRRAELMR